MTSAWEHGPASVPSFVSNGAPAPGRNGFHPSAAPRPATGVRFDSRTVDRVREAVSRQLVAAGAADYDAMDAETQRLRTRDLVNREVEASVLDRSVQGVPAWTTEEEDQLIAVVLAGLHGLGRLEPLLNMAGVEDIFYTGCDPTMLRMTDGTMAPGPAIADTDDEAEAFTRQLGTTLSDGSVREFSVARPLMTVRLKSVGALGARLAAGMDVLPRPAGSIRVHRYVEATLADAYVMRMIDRPLFELLRHAVWAGAKVLFVGSMHAGKTFLLRATCSEIPLDKMIVTVEDDRELGLHLLPARDVEGELILDAQGMPTPRRNPALVRPYESRPANSEGAGAVTAADILFHALRDSADVLVLGEARGGEIRHLLEAATNGTAGVMSSLHANSASDVFERIVQMSLAASPPMPVEWALRASTAIDLVVHVKQNRAHQRFVSEVLEIRSGPLGPTGVPTTSQLFTPREDERAVPYGTMSPALLARLEDVGFDRKWLEAGLSDWDRVEDTPGGWA